MTMYPEKSMDQVIREDGRYPLEAFAFLHEGLTHAIRDVHGSERGSGGQRHVTGKELCLGLRDFAIEQWGMLAKTVLNKWNIHATIDFGNMVYLLIDNELMKKTEQDNIEDFRDVFDFNEAFDVTGQFELKE